MKTRSEQSLSDTWKLEDILTDDAAWEALFQEASAELAHYQTFQGHLSDSSETLVKCLQFDDASSLKLEKLYVYARMRLDQDTSNQTYQELFARAQSLSCQASESSAFLNVEILELPKETLAAWMEADKDLAFYRRALSQLEERRPHTRNSSEEELLAQSQDFAGGISQVYTMFQNADLTFPSITGSEGETITITNGNFISLMENPDREVRRNAFLNFYSVYIQFQNTLAAVYSTRVKQAAFYAKARRYTSGRARALGENEIPEQVYDQLTATVRKHLPLLHRYVSMRKKRLSVEELHMYDLYAPLGSRPGKTYSFEEAKQMVKEGLAPLGEEYASLLEEAFANRWIDVYENTGKRGGAYSWGVYGTHPYVLLNFNGTLNQVFTLAHEMGHAIHTWYSDHAQPYTYAGYKIFVAEVASTCNEILLISHLLKTASPEEKDGLLQHFLETFRGTLFRQTMFAEFEAMAHKKAEEGSPLTAAELSSMYHQLNVDYFGPDMVVDAEIDAEWERIPHFYTPFYVYQYATGFSAAAAIAKRILAGEEGALEGYRQFLQGGCTRTPVELLKLAGVDMSTAKPVEDALQLFEEILGQMA